KLAPLDISKDQLLGPIESSAALTLGTSSESLPFQGKIDEVQMFRQELLPSDVADLAANKPVFTALDILALAPSERTDAHKRRLQSLFVGTLDAEFRRLQIERADLTNKKAALEKIMVPTMVMQELPKRRDTFLLKRGQYDQRGDKVEPGVPALFPPLPAGAPA